MINWRITPTSLKPRFEVEKVFSRLFLTEKLYNWLGILIFFFIAISFGYLMAQKTQLAINILILICGLAVLLMCLLNTETGLYIIMVFSFFAFHVSRYFNDTIPVGALSDILIFTTLFSFFVKRKGLRSIINEFSQKPVVKILLIIYAYTAIQLFNPNAQSFDSWYQGFRKVISTLFIFFIAFTVFDSYDRIKRFFYFLFVLATIAGVYGCYQEWFGLFSFEKNWIITDPHRFGLYFIQGDFRKFSTMSDPASFGVLMASCAVLFIILSVELKGMTKRIMLTGSIFMLLGMSYSGTRTANAMIVGGLILYILLTINNKRTKNFAIISTLIFLFIMYVPVYSNSTLNRFRTTFSGKNDESFNVREKNRKFIQPYIHSHPIGGGIGTTGGTGSVYHPGHVLAGFQPDSGYLKKAAEIGWIGLAIFCILYFYVLKSGVNGYFYSDNRQHKIIYAACICAIFCFYIGEFAQVAIGQITDVVVYYPLIAVILKLKNYDSQSISSFNNK